MEPTTQKRGVFLYIVFLALLTLAAGAGYYFGLTQRNNSNSTMVGFTKTQELIDQNSDLITSSDVTLTFSGKITAIEEGKSWTLEKKGKSVVLRHEGTGKVTYLRSEQGKNPVIEASEIKIGSNVLVNLRIDPKTGIISVSSVVLQP